MKFSVKKIAALSALSVLAIAPMLSATQASAQIVNGRGMTGTYVGGGIAAGVTSSDTTDATFGGNIQGRLPLQNTPVSLRGAVLFSDDTSAIMPLISYDIAVARNTNIYAGGGYSFVERDGRATPLGDQDSVVLTTGVETAVARNVVVYSDVKLGIDAFRDSSNPAVSFQLGAGYRF